MQLQKAICSSCFPLCENYVTINKIHPWGSQWVTNRVLWEEGCLLLPPNIISPSTHTWGGRGGVEKRLLFNSCLGIFACIFLLVSLIIPSLLSSPLLFSPFSLRQVDCQNKDVENNEVMEGGEEEEEARVYLTPALLFSIAWEEQQSTKSWS